MRLALFLAAGLAFGQPPLPQSAVFSLVGYGVKVDGTFGYAQLISQSSGAYSLSYFRYLPAHNGGLNLSFPALTTGVAVHMRDIGPVRLFALGQAGAMTTASATLFTSALGGFATVGTRKWKNVSFLLGVDMSKTASGVAYPNFDMGVVFAPGGRK